MNQSEKQFVIHVAAVCSALGVAISATASLIIASMDLKLVQLLRAAMQPGLAGGAGAALHSPSRIEPSKLTHANSPANAPRHIQPAAIFEPRRVHHPEPIFAPPGQIPVTAPASYHGKSALVPPWKTVPVQQLPPLRPVIKPVVYKVDTICKGNLLDIFM